MALCASRLVVLRLCSTGVHARPSSLAPCCLQGTWGRPPHSGVGAARPCAAAGLLLPGCAAPKVAPRSASGPPAADRHQEQGLGMPGQGQFGVVDRKGPAAGLSASMCRVSVCQLPVGPVHGCHEGFRGTESHVKPAWAEISQLPACRLYNTSQVPNCNLLARSAWSGMRHQVCVLHHWP